ncbi:MAG: M56 family metallopeptidase, partial [Planctomycetes bacterium]|nr:M56 family metallopeptidase [Planctomycetota bacterium]
MRIANLPQVANLREVPTRARQRGHELTFSEGKTIMGLVLTILVDAVVKGSLVLLAAAALTLLLRHASAAFRHLVWFLALASLLVLPILSAALPAWRVPILPPVVPAPLSAEDVSRAGSPATVPDEGSGQRDALRTIADFQKSAIPALGVQEDGENARFAPAARLRPLPPCDWAIGVLGLWGIGMVGAVGVLLMGTARVWRLTRQSTAITEPVWSSLLNELASTRRVRLLGSEQALIPMTWGVWRPVILLPSGAGDWPAERRRVVLTHELAHVRRLDYLTQTIAWFACALHWFNPLAWFALRRMRVEREQACDDYVLNAGLKPSDYASHLLDIVRSLRPLRASSIAAVAMARPSRLGRRVEAVLDIRRSRRAATRSLVLLAAAVALCILIPLGTLRPVAKAQE